MNIPPASTSGPTEPVLAGVVMMPIVIAVIDKPLYHTQHGNRSHTLDTLVMYCNLFITNFNIKMCYTIYFIIIEMLYYLASVISVIMCPHLIFIPKKRLLSITIIEN